MGYGKELVLDLHECDALLFNRTDLEIYFVELCALIDMQRCDLHFWDDVGVPEEERQTEPHLKGTSAVQFMLTSNVTVHALDILKSLYVNIFSCKEFDSDAATRFTTEYFSGRLVNREDIVRR